RHRPRNRGRQGRRCQPVRPVPAGGRTGLHAAARRPGRRVPPGSPRSQGADRMNAIPLEHGLALAAVLFSLGLIGLMVRRNILFVLMSLEVMMNATALAFVVAGSRWVQPDGQVMFILVITLAAAEASIGLAILLQLYRRFNTLDVDAASEMRG